MGFSFFSLFNLITNAFLQYAAAGSGFLIAKLISFNNDLTQSLFNNSAVISFIGLVDIIGAFLFVAGTAFAFADWAINSQENGKSCLTNTLKNVIIGFVALLSFSVIPPLLLSFTNNLCSQLTTDMAITQMNDYAQKMWDAGLHTSLPLFGTSIDIDIPNPFIGDTDAMDTIFMPIFVIIMLVCVLRLFLANIKRGGVMLILIFVCPMHLFSVPRGYTDAFYSWCKQVIAVCLTAFIESFLVALSLLVYSVSAEMFVSVGLALASFESPKIMQQFGIDTSMKANISQAIFGISGTMGIVRGFGGK